jgi:hypothetical protein
MCEMRRMRCDVMRGGILIQEEEESECLWEEEFMCERRRNACAMGQGIFI